MKTRILLLMLSAWLLTGAMLFAQNSGTQKGDVNHDGVINEQDVPALIKIMRDGGGVRKPTTYYWYVGQTNPSTMTEISPIVTDKTSPGWRLIGTELPNYSASNMLWNGDTYNITFSNRDYYYIAVPNESIKIYNAANGSVMDSFTNVSTKSIDGVTYYIYPCNSKARAFGYNIF